MKLTRGTGFFSHKGEEIHEGDGFIYIKNEWVHLSSRSVSTKQGFNEIYGGVMYDLEKKDWWIKSTHHPDKEIPLRKAKGVIPSS